MKVSFDHDATRAKEDTKLWAALALSREQKMGVEDPREMERLGQRRRGRRASALAGRVGPGRARRADRHLRRLRLRPPGLPLPGQRPGSRHRPVRRGHPSEAPRAVRLASPDVHSSAASTARPGSRPWRALRRRRLQPAPAATPSTAPSAAPSAAPSGAPSLAPTVGGVDRSELVPSPAPTPVPSDGQTAGQTRTDAWGIEQVWVPPARSRWAPMPPRSPP